MGNTSLNVRRGAAAHLPMLAVGTYIRLPRRLIMLNSLPVRRSRVQNKVALLRLFSVLLLVSLVVLPAGALAAPQGATSSEALTSKAIFFASDGMRPDLMEKYAAAGHMPTYAALMAAGVRGD